MKINRSLLSIRHNVVTVAVEKDESRVLSQVKSKSKPLFIPQPQRTPIYVNFKLTSTNNIKYFVKTT